MLLGETQSSRSRAVAPPLCEQSYADLWQTFSPLDLLSTRSLWSVEYSCDEDAFGSLPKVLFGMHIRRYWGRIADCIICYFAIPLWIPLLVSNMESMYVVCLSILSILDP